MTITIGTSKPTSPETVGKGDSPMIKVKTLILYKTLLYEARIHLLSGQYFES